MPPGGALTADQLGFVDANGESAHPSAQASAPSWFLVPGYLMLEAFSSAKEVAAMRGHMAELVDGFDGANRTRFTEDHRQLMDAHFFKSAENAFGNDGCLKQPEELSIKKIGHVCLITNWPEDTLCYSLHELDPVFKKFSFSDSISSMFSSMDYKRPAIIQSMYIFKQPGIGDEVVPHQDNTFLYAICSALRYRSLQEEYNGAERCTAMRYSLRHPSGQPRDR
ncbi:hypothetical protein ACP4OV_001785 [Aristida adscensionis]